VRLLISRPLLRRQDAGDAPALLTWRRFDLADVFQASEHLLDDALAFFDVRQLSATEDHGNDHLVFVRQEFAGSGHLHFDVVFARFGAHTNFFYFAVVSLAAVQALFLLILEFAEIHDAADRRPLIGSHFDEIQARLARRCQRLIGRNNP
jgi:hypothetical protein